MKMQPKILRRTKILATLGPQTDDEKVLTELIQNGTNVVRLNLSHGTHIEFKQRVALVKQISEKLKTPVGILADLQGPKIRIGAFKDSKVELKEGNVFTLNIAADLENGNVAEVGLIYKKLIQDVQVSDVLILADGLIEIQVTEIKKPYIICKVITGGWLASKQGINLKGGGLSAPALTDKDKQDLKFLSTIEVDYIALSFVRCVKDIQDARNLLAQHNIDACLIAKIERAEALDNLDAIILASDGVMVARGDLGVEIGYSKLPGIQKHIISRARALNRAVITATQMMDSMCVKPLPTRAEVFDVANAVLDGTDAVMLSQETATGNHPALVVQHMHQICLSAEQERVAKKSLHRMESHFERVDEAVAMACMYAANHMDTKAIVALTESGSTPLWMSRIHSGIPIFALSRHKKARDKMTLFRGVYPFDFDVTKPAPGEVSRAALDYLKHLKILRTSDKIILTKGEVMGVGGKSNTVKFLTV